MKAFLEQVDNSGAGVDKNIIGQFGVGFYSTFMVGEKIEVYTKSSDPYSAGLYWASDGYFMLLAKCFSLLGVGYLMLGIH